MTNDSSWLESLESTVRRASAELERLRRENSDLRQQVTSLEAQSEPSNPSSPSESAVEWQAERQEIRQRVESLAAGLEALLVVEDPAD